MRKLEVQIDLLSADRTCPTITTSEYRQVDVADYPIAVSPSLLGCEAITIGVLLALVGAVDSLAISLDRGAADGTVPNRSMFTWMPRRPALTRWAAPSPIVTGSAARRDFNPARAA
jgi:hypothetical protein